MRRLITPHRQIDTTSDTLALWRCGDEVGEGLVDDGGVYDLAENDSPGEAGSLFAVPAGTIGARTLNGSSQYFSGTADADFRAAILDEWTITCVCRPASVGGPLPIITMDSSSQGAADDNILLDLSIKSGEVRVLRQNGTNNEVEFSTTGLNLIADRTYLIFARNKFHSAGFSSVTLGYYDLDTGEGDSETFANLANATGGADTEIVVGASFYAGGFFDGAMSELRVEKVPLTDEAIRRIALDYAADYDEQALYDRGIYDTHVRVKTADGDGVMRDLTALARGTDFVLSAQWSEDIDGAGQTFTIELAREHHLWSLARDMEESPLNLRTSDGLFDPLVGVNRRTLIETAVVPAGFEVRDIDFTVEVEGRTDDVDWSQPNVVVSGRDKIGELQDTLIESTGSTITAIDDTGAGSTAEIETEDAHGLSAGQRVSVHGTPDGDYDGSFTVADVPTVFTLRTAEAIGGSPDAASSGFLYGPDLKPYGSDAGQDADVTMQEIIDENEPAGGYMFEHVVYGTGVDHKVRTYNQKIEPVQAALDVIATATGRTLRYAWDDDRYDFRLLYSMPDINKSTPDWTMSARDYLDVQSVGVAIVDIRNAVEGRFVDMDGTPDADGNYPRRIVKMENAASIAKYGRRAAVLSEGSTSPINRLVEMEALLTAFLAYLSEPKALLETVHPYRRFVQLGDLGRFEANDVHWSSDKDLAAVSRENAFQAGGQVTTTLRLRGQPAGARLKLFQMIVHPGLAPNTPTTGTQAPSGLAVQCVTGGMHVSWDRPGGKGNRQYDRTEVYLSTVDGFDPSATVPYETTPASGMFIPNLTGGTPYHVVIRHMDRAGNPSPYSEQVSCTPISPPPPPSGFASQLLADQEFLSSGVVLFNELLDTDAQYNPATGEFTCVKAGLWSFDVKVVGTLADGLLEIQSHKGVTWSTIKSFDMTGFSIASVTLKSYLAAGDKVRVHVTYGTARVNLDGHASDFDAGSNFTGACTVQS